MTLIDELNSSGTPTGKKYPKNIIHEQGMWHSAAHIWIYNKNGEVLMQLRAKGKDSFPGYWDISVAGHVDSGEKPLEAAVRELSEEIGINILPDQLTHAFTERISNNIEEINWQNNEFDFVYLLEFNQNTNKLNLKRDEVEKLEFVASSEFIQFFKNRAKLKRKLIPGTEDYYKKVWEAINKELTKQNKNANKTP